MNVRSNCNVSQAAKSLAKYSLRGSLTWANFNAVKSGMVRVAKTSLFLYKSNVTAFAVTFNKNTSHNMSPMKKFNSNCIWPMAIVDVCFFLFILFRPFFVFVMSSAVFFLDFKFARGISHTNDSCVFNTLLLNLFFSQWPIARMYEQIQ